MQTHPPPPQFWYDFYGWCAMCWNEWKISFSTILLKKSWALSLRICRPPPTLNFDPVFHGWCAMCWNEWKIKFSDFHFSSHLEYFIENLTIKITRKTEIEKIGNLIFLAIPHRSNKFDHLWFFFLFWCRHAYCIVHTHACKTMQTFAKYSVDANLFRLGSTNLKKKYPCLGWKKNIYFFFQKCFNIWRKKNPFFFLPKVFKSTWRIRNRLNWKKDHISDFFFELWSFLYHNFRWILYYNLKNKNRRIFELFFPFWIETEGRGRAAYLDPKKN